MSEKMTPFQAGELAGNEADVPMDAFEMSQRHDDFIIGYIVGYSEMESFRQARPSVAAMTAGELGYRYNAPFNTLLPHMGFDAELRKEMAKAYAVAAKTAAEEGEDDDNP
ncbi:DUF2623 family protein [Cupriavidus necator]|uniref:DUF2623 family protein n=2 Tax=Cupriavidus necator TaxID=106590 RepID=A0A367PCM6_CUPNE|nr:DUF2623 family protein [Cupriavidus necator]